jgi:hypothetical protein
MTTEPSPDDIRAVAQVLAEGLRHNRDLFVAFAGTAQRAAEQIDGVLQALEQLDKPAPPTPPKWTRETAADVFGTIRGHIFETIRGQITAHMTVTGQAPIEIALTTAMREGLLNHAERQVGHEIIPIPDHLFGLPITVDDTIPHDPGFEIRPRR